MKFCCDGFKGHFDVRHERGFLVFATRQSVGGVEEPSFHFGCRPVARDAIPRVREALKGHDGIGSIYLSGCAGMRFCPWCGTELRKFYRDTWRELVDQKISDEFGTAA